MKKEFRGPVNRDLITCYLQMLLFINSWTNQTHFVAEAKKRLCLLEACLGNNVTYQDDLENNQTEV